MLKYFPRFNDVYQALNVTQKRTGEEIQRVIAKEKGLPVSDVIALPINAHARELVRMGLANEGEKELSLYQMKIRGGNPSFEYWLTDEGLRRRVKSDQKTSQGIEGVLVPSKA